MSGHALAYMEENLMTAMVEDVAAALHLNRKYLSWTFKKFQGCTEYFSPSNAGAAALLENRYICGEDCRKL